MGFFGGQCGGIVPAAGFCTACFPLPCGSTVIARWNIRFDARPEIGRYSRLRRTIVNTGVKVPESSVIGFDLEADRAKGYHVTDANRGGA